VIGLHKQLFPSRLETISSIGTINNRVGYMNSDIVSRFANFNSKNTKYRFNRVLYADIQSSKHTHLRGGTFIELPRYYKNKKCCINVKNTKTNKLKCLKQENLRCFEYALESILNPADKNSERPSNYNIEKYEKLNIEYPVNIIEENIQKYEEFLNIAINVYEIKEVETDTYRIEFRYPSQNYKDRKCVNLLLYKNHVGIKNSGLLKGQITKRNKKRYFCQKCQRSFEKEEKYNQHVE
jgi:hypothetical protein